MQAIIFPLIDEMVKEGIEIIIVDPKNDIKNRSDK